MLKEDILKALAQNRDKSLSGQELAARFEVSRNAVWKAVKQLQSEGITIEAGTNRGYRLGENVLTPYDLSLPAGVQTRFYQTIDSTNTQAKRLLAEGLRDNMLIAANEQTAGRGRCGRSFYSPGDTGIYYSYIFHPQKTLADAVFITTAAAVSVVRAIESLSTLKPGIKWVNDIYLEDKKVCGILTEAVSDFESGNLESVIVGIGINYSTSVFPPELAATAGGLNDSGFSRAALLQAAARELIAVCEDLENPRILEEYKAHSVVLGKEISFTKNGASYRATAVDIDEKGALVVETAQGRQVLSSGEISVRFTK